MRRDGRAELLRPWFVGGLARERGARDALFGRLLDPQHTAERAQQAGHAGVGLQQGRHLRVADQALQLRREGCGGGETADQPAVAGGQAAGFERARLDGLSRDWRASRGGSGGSGLDGPGEDGGETGEDAGQAVPDADDLWDGHAGGEACDDDGAKGIDHRDEAVGGGKGCCPGHEHNKNIVLDGCQW